MSRAAQLAVELTESGASKVAAGLDDVTGSAQRMGDTVDSASKQAKTAGARLDSTAESADEMASKGSQAAGAMSGLGDLIGGPFGAAMATGGIGLQAMADSGDLLNAALENSVVASARAKAGTVAKTVADKASAAATRVMTVAQKALNLAQRASPIGLIIAGVLLLVGALVLAYNRSARFRAIVQGAMAVARAAVDKVKGAFAALGPAVGKVMAFIARVVGLYVRVYVGAFKLGLAGARLAWNAIRDVVASVIDAVTSKVQSIKGKLGDVWSWIKRTGSGAFNALLGPIQHIIDLVQSLLDKIKSIHLPHVDVNPFNRSAATTLARATAGGGALVATGDTIMIQVRVESGASARDADSFMRAVDARLRAKGKAPVFT